jgi:6-phospho-beta-glucosidase
MAKNGIKMTVLGGGSYFTPSFIGTMCRRPEVFTDTEVRLHDVNAERVKLVKAFNEQFVKAKNVPMTFIDEPDLDRAIEGADFVITTFRIGGEQSLILDETIPPRFGYYGDETMGPGGMFMAIRTVPVVIDVAKRMERLCPDAWLLNYANPTNFITDALKQRSKIKSAGLCDGYITPPREIGQMLDIPKEKIKARHAGINHCSWAFQAEYEGKDVFQMLRDAEDKIINENISKQSEEVAEVLRGNLDLFKIFNFYPLPSDHIQRFYNHDMYLDKQKKSKKIYHTLREDENKANWEGLKKVIVNFDEKKAEQVAKAHKGAHADLAIGVTAAIASNSGEVFHANVPNGGAYQDISPETVMELPCKVSKNGFSPQPVPKYPKSITAQQTYLSVFQQLVVQGILEKNKNLFIQALILEPFTSSVAIAKDLFNTMWDEEREVLGDYWQDKN